MAEEPEIPSYFLCPISLQIMRDPVTLSTGITYDRPSIERWLLNDHHHTCPTTNLVLPDIYDLTPNHTLRRLIQAWCVLHASDGIERFPTPRPPVDQSHISKILEKVNSPPSQLSALQSLKSIAYESERNRKCVLNTPGAIDLLASIVICEGSSESRDEALSILSCVQIPDHALIELVSKNDDFIDALTRVLRVSNDTSCANAMFLLKAIVSVVAPARLMCMQENAFAEIVRVLRDKIATRVALETLIGLCPWGKNRLKSVRSGAVHVLIEILIDDGQERRVSELVLVLLDKLCGCAEGREEFVKHAAGIAVVSKKILRVSTFGNERAVKILYSISRYSGTEIVLKEMVNVGAVSKLSMMLLVDCGSKAKERAREILKMHSRIWRRSPCLPPQFRDLYPC